MVPASALAAEVPAASGSLEPPQAATPIRAATAVSAKAILVRFIMISLWLGSRRCDVSTLCPLGALLQGRGRRCRTRTVVKRLNGPISSGQAPGHYRTLNQGQQQVHDQGQDSDEHCARGGLWGIPHGEPV